MLPDILRMDVIKVVGSPPVGNPVALQPTGRYQAVLSGHSNQWVANRPQVVGRSPYGSSGLMGHAKLPVGMASPTVSGPIFVAGRRIRS